MAASKVLAAEAHLAWMPHGAAYVPIAEE